MMAVHPGRWPPARMRARAAPLAHAQAANDVWTVDFKGWFKTGDGQRCDPLTLRDAASRYLLRCRVLKQLTCDQVWPQFDVAFRAHGLPRTVRSGNGAPFASPALGGLSRLAVKLIKAGVVPERIRPGKPQENGRHERLHLTLEQETACPPARHYEPAPRLYSGRLRSPDYADHHEVRRVRGNGEIKWRGRSIFISGVLAGELCLLVQLARSTSGSLCKSQESR